MELIRSDTHPHLWCVLTEAWKFADFEHSGSVISGGPLTANQLRQAESWLHVKSSKFDVAEQTRAWCDGRRPSFIPAFSDAMEISNGADAGADVALLLYAALSGDL